MMVAAWANSLCNYALPHWSHLTLTDFSVTAFRVEPNPSCPLCHPSGGAGGAAASVSGESTGSNGNSDGGGGGGSGGGGEGKDRDLQSQTD